MENASKALLIAGGILIALVIISLLVITFTKIGDYQKSQSGSSIDSQLAEFNRDFERYTEDDIKGVDIVSLINKINDYNTKSKNILSETTSNDSKSIDYNIKITLTVDLKKFNDDHANTYGTKLFKNDVFTYDGKSTQSNTLKKELDGFKTGEGEVGIEGLKKLSNIYSSDPQVSEQDNIRNLQDELKKINPQKYKNWNGTTPAPSLDTIKMYIQYSEFKNSKFRAKDNPVYKNGQICELSFEYIG